MAVDDNNGVEEDVDARTRRRRARAARRTASHGRIELVFIVCTLLTSGVMTLGTLGWMLAYGVDAPVMMPRTGTAPAWLVLILAAPLFLINIVAAWIALRR